MSKNTLIEDSNDNIFKPNDMKLIRENSEVPLINIDIDRRSSSFTEFNKPISNESQSLKDTQKDEFFKLSIPNICKQKNNLESETLVAIPSFSSFLTQKKNFVEKLEIDDLKPTFKTYQTEQIKSKNCNFSVIGEKNKVNDFNNSSKCIELNKKLIQINLSLEVVNQDLFLINSDYSKENPEFSETGIKNTTLKIAGSVLVSQIILNVRYFLLFIFSRNQPLSVTTAVSTVTSIYQILTFGTSWSFTQNFGFEVAHAIGSKNHFLTGKLTNQSFVLSFILGTFLSTLMIFGARPFFSNFIEDIDTLNVIESIFKWLSISTPFQFVQHIQVRYFSAIKHKKPLIVGSLLCVLIQMFFMMIFFYNNLINIGLSLSFGLGTIFNVTYNFYHYLYKNPEPKNLLKFKISHVTDDLFNFLKRTVPIFLLMFLTFISYDLIPFFSFIISETAFAIYGVIVSLLAFSFVFSESIAVATNILICRSIGIGELSNFKKIINFSILINTIYVVIVSAVLIGYYESLINLLTEVEIIRIEAYKMKEILIFSNIMFSFHGLLSESLSALKNEVFALKTLLIGRFISGFILCYVIIKYVCIYEIFKPILYSSVLIGMTLGQTLINIINYIKLKSVITNFKLDESDEELPSENINQNNKQIDTDNAKDQFNSIIFNYDIQIDKKFIAKNNNNLNQINDFQLETIVNNEEIPNNKNNDINSKNLKVVTNTKSDEVNTNREYSSNVQDTFENKNLSKLSENKSPTHFSVKKSSIQNEQHLSFNETQENQKSLSVRIPEISYIVEPKSGVVSKLIKYSNHVKSVKKLIDSSKSSKTYKNSYND